MKFEFPRRDLILEGTIGEGEFCRVLSASAMNIRVCIGNERLSCTTEHSLFK